MTGYQAYDTEDDEIPMLSDEEAPVHVHNHGNGLTGKALFITLVESDLLIGLV